MRAIWNTATTSSRDSVCSTIWESSETQKGDSLSANEISEAHTLWIKEMQRAPTAELQRAFKLPPGKIF